MPLRRAVRQPQPLLSSTGAVAGASHTFVLGLHMLPAEHSLEAAHTLRHVPAGLSQRNGAHGVTF